VRKSVADAPVQKVLRVIHARFREELDFHALAREHGISYSSLRRAVKTCTGLPPQHYLNRVRITRAKELLCDSGRPIKQVAEEVGIENPYYFSTRFRQYEEMSPRQFRLSLKPFDSE